jgi:hypothetical protein
MNKKFLTIFAVMAIGALAAFNLTLDNQGNRAFDLSLANTQVHAYDLEEVVITCGQTHGRCWVWAPVFNCIFTGNMNNWCF